MSAPPPRRPPPKRRKPLPFGIQKSFFGDTEVDKEYTAKIRAPIYEPKNRKPALLELTDVSRCRKLIEQIDASDLPDDEKYFLTQAASRHIVFNYHLIADYYAHASAETQRLMEESALVIIDFGDAIRRGFVQFGDEIAQLYIQEHDGQPE